MFGTNSSGLSLPASQALERAAPGHPDDAVMWESVEDQAEAGAVPTLSYHVFLVIAVELLGIRVTQTVG